MRCSGWCEARHEGAAALLIPFKTDAPVYHYPWATIGVIAVNVAVFAGTWTGAIDPDPWMLDHDTFQPLQWVTSNFLHAGVVHLLGNMIFLWVFGQIVEGKVGWWRFLAIFLGIGVPQCAVEQLMFSGGSSLGASSIVFGLLGVSLVWAPLNDVTFVWWVFPLVGQFDAKVRTVALFYTAWEVLGMGLSSALLGFGVSSGFLHLMGIAIGVPIGVVMLRKGWVDCESWDWFSVQRGDHRKNLELASLRRVRTRVIESVRGDPERTLGRLRASLAAGDAKRACDAYDRFPGRLEEPELRAMIDLLFDAGRWRRCRTLLKEYVERFPETAAPMRLRLGAIAIRRQCQPTKGMRLLATVRADRLTANERTLYRTLRSEGARMSAANALEFDDDGEL